MCRERTGRFTVARVLGTILCLVCLGSIGILRLWPERHVSRPSRHDIAHEILALEAKYGATSDETLLDHLIDGARKSIGTIRGEDVTEAVRVLRAIDATLREQGFAYRAGTLLLSDSLTMRRCSQQDAWDKLDNHLPTRSSEEEGQAEPDLETSGHRGQIHFADCDTLTYLYLGVGESLNLPLRAVAGPRHLFVRWHFKDGSYFNWDTTHGDPCTDSRYRKDFHIATTALTEGVYLRSLTRREVLCHAYINIARYLKQAGRVTEAAIILNREAAQCPRSVYAIYSRGVFRHDCGLDEQAEADLRRVVELDPHHVKASLLCGILCYRRGDIAGAIRDFGVVLDIEPKHTVALLNRAAAWRSIGRYDRAIDDYTMVAETNAAPEAYVNRAIVYIDMKEYRKAKTDLDLAVAQQPEDTHVLNACAWFFATVPDAELADPARAVRLARKALQKETCDMTLDTLAASMARAGEFESACEVEMAAIELASDPTTREEFQKRLDLFRRHMEYVQE